MAEVATISEIYCKHDYMITLSPAHAASSGQSIDGKYDGALQETGSGLRTSDLGEALRAGSLNEVLIRGAQAVYDSAEPAIRPGRLVAFVDVVYRAVHALEGTKAGYNLPRALAEMEQALPHVGQALEEGRYQRQLARALELSREFEETLIVHPHVLIPDSVDESRLDINPERSLRDSYDALVIAMQDEKQFHETAMAWVRTHGSPQLGLGTGTGDTASYRAYVREHRAELEHIEYQIISRLVEVASHSDEELRDLLIPKLKEAITLEYVDYDRPGRFEEIVKVSRDAQTFKAGRGDGQAVGSAVALISHETHAIRELREFMHIARGQLFPGADGLELTGHDVRSITNALMNRAVKSYINRDALP
jgi:hypothetical protein